MEVEPGSIISENSAASGNGNKLTQKNPTSLLNQVSIEVTNIPDSVVD